MAGPTGLLVLSGINTSVPGNPPASANMVALQFPVAQGQDLLAAAAAFASTLNLPIGTTAQVFDASTSGTYKLTGTWS